MADVGCSKDEDDRGEDSDADDTPEGPDEATSRVADSKHGNANTGFNWNGAGRIEELGDEE